MRCDLKIGFAGLCGTRIGKQKKTKKKTNQVQIFGGAGIFSSSISSESALANLARKALTIQCVYSFCCCFFSSLSSVV